MKLQKKKQFGKKLNMNMNMWSDLSVKNINYNRNAYTQSNLITISSTNVFNKNVGHINTIGQQHVSLMTVSNCNNNVNNTNANNRRMSQSLSSFDFHVNNTDVKSNNKTIGINKRQYSNYHLSLFSVKKQSDKKELFYSTNHSIFSLFRRNFKNKFNSNINQTLKQQCKTSLNFKSQDNNPNQTTNDNNNNNNNNSHTTKLNTSNKDTTTLPKETSTTNNNNTQPTLPKLNSFKSLSPSPSTSNSFNEPSTINTNYKRLRNFTHYTNPDYILTSKWKLKEGIYSTDIKYNKTLSLDLSFQSKYIKDEIKLLIDNITYMRTNLLCTNDIITAIKNKNFQFQININKCIEETIAFINMINRIILKHKSDYYDDLLSHSNIDMNIELQTQSITNEVECFICNIKLLCKLSSCLEKCFEMYLHCVKKVNEFIITLKNFEVLRQVLQKTRYNVNVIIQSGKGALKDFYYDKCIIDKIDNILNKNVISKHDIHGCVRKKRKDLMEHFKSQLEFGKNEFVMKRRRIVKALEEKKEEIDVEKEGNGKDKGKGRNVNKRDKYFMYNMKIVDGVTMKGPMSIIVSINICIYIYIYVNVF